MSENQSIIEISNLGKTYSSGAGRVTALSALNLDVKKGEILGLLGPNGAGKTTAVKLIMGFIHPSLGEIRFKGELLKPTDARPGIGYLPESFRPNPNLTVIEYLKFQRDLGHKGKSGQPADKLMTLLERVGMDRFKDRRISDLSKGMGQRLGLAQAFSNDPDLLILDEPTSGLDPLGKGEVNDILLSMKAGGKTIFFSSHILSEVEGLCDRIGVIVGGRLTFMGTVEAFFGKWGSRDLDACFKMEAGCKAV